MDISIDFLKENWIWFAIVAFFGYRFYRARKIKAQLPELMKQNPFLLDVRTGAEFAMGSVPNSVNIPLQELPSAKAKIPNDRLILVFCASGARSSAAVGILTGMGFTNVKNMGAWTNLIS